MQVPYNHNSNTQAPPRPLLLSPLTSFSHLPLTSYFNITLGRRPRGPPHVHSQGGAHRPLPAERQIPAAAAALGARSAAEGAREGQGAASEEAEHEPEHESEHRSKGSGHQRIPPRGQEIEVYRIEKRGGYKLELRLWW